MSEQCMKQSGVLWAYPAEDHEYRITENREVAMEQGRKYANSSTSGRAAVQQLIVGEVHLLGTGWVPDYSVGIHQDARAIPEREPAEGANQ